MTTTRKERSHRAMCRQSRWYATLQEHQGLLSELVQAHLDLIAALKPVSLGGPVDGLADIALWQMRDVITQLCNAVGLNSEPDKQTP